MKARILNDGSVVVHIATDSPRHAALAARLTAPPAARHYAKAAPSGEKAALLDDGSVLVHVRPESRHYAGLVERYGAAAHYAHAPKGGVTIQGKNFTGGEFIPADVMASATAAEKDEVRFGDTPQALFDEPPADLPDPETVPVGKPVKSKNGSMWIKAKKGGEISPVNGVHYKGGRWMPIHGLSPKQVDKPKAKPPQGGDMPKPPTEDGGRVRTPRQPMTQEQIAEEKERRKDQAKWTEMAAGPLGRLKWLGDTPNHKAMSDSRTNLNSWKEFAAEAGEQKVAEMAKTLETMVHAQIDKEVADDEAKTGAKVPTDNVQWAKDTPKREAEQDAAGFGGKKHAKQVPSSFYARQLLQEAIGQAKSVSDLHKLNAILTGSDVARYAKEHDVSGEKRDEGGKWTAGGGHPTADEQPEPQPDHAADYKVNGIRAKAFKAWFGDWEKEPENASKVVNDKGEPQETHTIPGSGSQVMRDGKPVAVYHGTAKGGFDAFDKSKSSEGSLYGQGFYFTEDESVAKEYQEKDRPYELTRPLDAKDMKKAERWFNSKQVERDMYSDIGIREHMKSLHRAWKEGPEAFGARIALEDHKHLMGILKVERRPLGNPETKAVYLNIRKPFDMESTLTHEQIAQLFGPANAKAFTKQYGYYGDKWPGKLVYENIKIDGKTGDKEAANKCLRQWGGHDGITHIGGAVQGNRKHKVWIAFEPNQIKALANQGSFDPADNRVDYAKSGMHPAFMALFACWQHGPVRYDKYYHGPNPPGGADKWKLLRTGVKGGRIWERVGAEPALAPAPPVKPPSLKRTILDHLDNWTNKATDLHGAMPQHSPEAINAALDELEASGHVKTHQPPHGGKRHYPSGKEYVEPKEPDEPAISPNPIIGQRQAMAAALQPFVGDKADDIADRLGLRFDAVALKWRIKDALAKEDFNVDPPGTTEENKDAVRAARHARYLSNEAKVEGIAEAVTEKLVAHLGKHGIGLPKNLAIHKTPEQQAEESLRKLTAEKVTFNEKTAGENRLAKEFGEKHWKKPPEPHTVTGKQWIAVRFKQKIEQTKKDLAKLMKLDARLEAAVSTDIETGMDTGDYSRKDEQARVTAELKKPAMRKLFNKYHYSWDQEKDQCLSGAIYAAKEFASTMQQEWDAGPTFSDYGEVGVLAHKEHMDAIKEATAKGADIPDELLRDYQYEAWLPEKYKDKLWTHYMLESHAQYMKDAHQYGLGYLEKATQMAGAQIRPLLDLAESSYEAAHKELTALVKPFDTPERLAMDQARDARRAFAKTLHIVEPFTDIPLGDLEPGEAKALKNLDAKEAAAETAYFAKRHEIQAAEHAIGQKWLALLLPKQGNPAANIPDADYLESKEELAKANTWLHKAVDASWGVMPVKLVKLASGDRANESQGEIRTNPKVGAGTLVHEFGHLIEEQHGNTLGMLSKAFAMERVKSFKEEMKHMGQGYENTEIGAKDGFLDQYTGKFYAQDASEVLSRGMEEMYKEPLGFFAYAPNHFAYTLMAMHGMFFQ